MKQSASGFIFSYVSLRVLCVGGSGCVVRSPCSAPVVTGTVSGTVVDPKGAVVASADVTSTKQGKGATEKGTSNSMRAFRFTMLPKAGAQCFS